MNADFSRHGIYRKSGNCKYIVLNVFFIFHHICVHLLYQILRLNKLNNEVTDRDTFSDINLRFRIISRLIEMIDLTAYQLI